MKLKNVLRRIRDNRTELENLGVMSVSVFGSVARGEEQEHSDIDLAITYDRKDSRILTIQAKIQFYLDDIFEGEEVQFITEPIKRKRLLWEVNRDRVLAY